MKRKQTVETEKSKRKKTNEVVAPQEAFCVIYIRVSTDEQSKEGCSLDSQRARCEEYAKFYHLTVRGVFEDVMSGKKKENREGILGALQALQTGDKLIVVALSRLSRSVRDTIEIADTLKTQGCHLVSVTEQIDTTTASGNCFFTILAAMNQMESQQTGERVKAGMKHKQSRGEDLGPPSYGWEYIDKVLVKKPDEQTVIKLIRAKSDEGLGYNKICEFLEIEGILTKRAKGRIARGKPPTKWCPSTISRILTDPRNQESDEENEENQEENEEGAEETGYTSAPGEDNY